MVRIKKGKLIMIHHDYGEASIVAVFRRNKILWVRAELSEYHWVETPRSEWKLKEEE